MNDHAPRGNSLAARDIAALVHPYTNLRAHQTDGPIVMTKGRGVYVVDDNGKEYIEGLAGLWCASLGFDERRLVEAAEAQMRALPFYHIFAGKSHEPGIVLAEMLKELAPVPMSKIFFANSGSEANDTAIKLVWYVSNAKGEPKRKKILSREKAYHGVTIAAASLTRLPANQRDFDLPIFPVAYAETPHHYRNALPGESEEQFAARLAENLEKLILAEGPETIAAMFVEPVMGAGGAIVPPKGYFARIQPVLRKYGILLVADEVICGFGRTGNMWGCQTLGIEPDILTCAKALSSAYLPISAVMISEGVWQTMVEQSAKIGTFGHGYTYTAHPVPAAVAIETLKIYAERDIVGHVRAVGPRLQAGLAKLADHPLVGEVQGVGLIAGLQLVKNKSPKTFFETTQPVAPIVAKACEAAGLIVRPLFDNRVAVCPPLVIEESEIDELLARLARGLDDGYKAVKDKGFLT
ncbi:MAG: aspartate aminotransferase family protein [Tagaea sp.]|nr:aspartate aminotransferase family protein [Azospirillum sp.]MCA3265377.1 aspartate aminotransferase family protein [Azospirillum sp.]MCZ8125136.1 aspartate aminotransferase family protein [Magnetospirillum sp.]